MRDRTHVPGCGDNRVPRIGKDWEQRVGDQARGRWRVLAADNQYRRAKSPERAPVRRFVEQGTKFKDRLGQPANDCILQRWPDRIPGALPTPIVDKSFGGRAPLASANSSRDR